MWFIACCCIYSQTADMASPYLCRFIRHGPWLVWKQFNPINIAFRWIGFFLYCSVVLLSLFVFLIFSRLATMFNKSESESESNRKQSNQTICNKYRNLTNRHNTQAFKQQVRAYVLTLSWLSSSAVSARLSVRWRWRASTLWRDSDAGRLRGRDTCALPL